MEGHRTENRLVTSLRVGEGLTSMGEPEVKIVPGVVSNGDVRQGCRRWWHCWEGGSEQNSPASKVDLGAKCRQRCLVEVLAGLRSRDV